jgi:hypothetical protein
MKWRSNFAERKSVRVSDFVAANTIDYAKHRSRAHDAVINVYDAAGKLIEVHRHKGDFREW